MPGRCTDDSDRRCKAHRRNGEQCHRWAMRESEYCPFHGGRQRKKLRLAPPRFYSAFLTTTLKKAVARSLRMSPQRQLSLLEELALSRDVCGQAAALYAAARETNKVELVTFAGEVMRDALDHVRTMCESASKVALASDDRISVHNIAFVVNQVVRVVYMVLGDEDADKAEAIAEALREELLLDDAAPSGVHLTPESDVADMIDSVPKADDAK